MTLFYVILAKMQVKTVARSVSDGLGHRPAVEPVTDVPGSYSYGKDTKF